ncbi:MAG: S8 family serine peptidase [Cyclobacteriaceae bacterium]
MKILPAGSDDINFDDVLLQVNGHALTEAGLTGKNIKIGIIDAGFYRADKQNSLYYVFERGGFRGYRNFIDPQLDDPFSRLKENDYHGTRVWQMIAGYRPGEEMNGLARDADFYLARTDEDPKEYRGEEDFWIAAVEWMASEGVQIINSSLGYSDGHDDPNEDYVPSDADGKSSALTRFANIAVYEKELIIIMSAGNSGNESFKVVNIPADAPGVIAVGATNLNFWTKQGYSSIGGHTLPYIKPDLACYSSSGTSFSAPVITGLAACLMEADSTLSNLDIAAILRLSSNLRYFPNNYLGYGVPDAGRALKILKGVNPEKGNNNVIIAEADTIRITRITSDPVIFHKINSHEVDHQEFRLGKGPEWIIKRPGKEISHSTFAMKDGAVEVVWPDY